MTFLEVPHFLGTRAVRRPLAARDEDELREALADGELWRTWCTPVPGPESVGADVVRGGVGERLTDNTLIRVALDLLMQRGDELAGTTDDELSLSLEIDFGRK